MINYSHNTIYHSEIKFLISDNIINLILPYHTKANNKKVMNFLI